MSIGRNMVILSVFNKISQKSISLTDVFQLHKYQTFAFINELNASKRHQGSVKFRLQKLLVHNGLSKILHISEILYEKLKILHEKLLLFNANLQTFSEVYYATKVQDLKF